MVALKGVSNKADINAVSGRKCGAGGGGGGGKGDPVKQTFRFCRTRLSPG